MNEQTEKENLVMTNYLRKCGLSSDDSVYLMQKIDANRDFRIK